MRWFGWWRKRKIEAPRNVVTENHSERVLKQSEKKLEDALKTKKEVTQLIKANDQFAEALQRAMRRSHG